MDHLNEWFKKLDKLEEYTDNPHSTANKWILRFAALSALSIVPIALAAAIIDASRNKNTIGFLKGEFSKFFGDQLYIGHDLLMLVKSAITGRDAFNPPLTEDEEIIKDIIE